jgi:FtsH-binding integral membrane protein
MIGAMALILFPKLALGLSGFETGVAVMPLVRGDATDTDAAPRGRIRNTKKLLRTAALIMSVMLLGSSFVTAVLIPPDAFLPRQPADGRALAYLAHERLGQTVGTTYDIVTILILWFAGASAMAGLLNLVPRYLPRYGMAPEWARANRPLVVIITGITFLVTIVFNASVEAQGGAYATGVLVLMSSAALAVAVMAWRHNSRWVPFVSITVVFIYTSITNVFERPEGIKIASLFIVSIIVTSLVSRALRSTELRVQGIVPDETAMKFIADAADREEAIRIIANRPGDGSIQEYEDKLEEARHSHHLTPNDPVLFLEVRPGDASQFSEVLNVQGATVGPHRVLRCQSPAIPNAIAALLLFIRDRTGEIPHVYFGWTEGNPITYLLKFLAFGEGDTAPVTREVLRQSEHDPLRRPHVHVG